MLPETTSKGPTSEEPTYRSGRRKPTLPETKQDGLTTWAVAISADFSVPATQGRGLSDPRVLTTAVALFKRDIGSSVVKDQVTGRQARPILPHPGPKSTEIGEG